MVIAVDLDGTLTFTDTLHESVVALIRDNPLMLFALPFWLVQGKSVFKAKLAVRQSLDLQRMQGSNSTLPVLILETCGTALVNSQAVKTYIGLSYLEQGMVLIFSSKLKAIQLLKDN
mgnify:CR=1 FL=1